MAQLKFSRANYRLWSERFQKTFTRDAEIGPAYMAAWHEGAHQMLEFLQAEASEGKDALRSIGDYAYLEDFIVPDREYEGLRPLGDGMYENLNAVHPDESIVFVLAETPFRPSV